MILDNPEIPASMKADAEHVRAHLVFLRGGAPFLSPADALCLVEWLDAGLRLHVILTALERCVESRRRSQAKRPLTLRAAKRHLHKPPLTAPALPRGEVHPFEGLSASLKGSPDGPALAEALQSLPEGDDLVVSAVALCRETVQERWEALSDTERSSRIVTAGDELGDLGNIVDAETFRALAEEVARESFRAQWPRLDTASLSSLVDP